MILRAVWSSIGDRETSNQLLQPSNDLVIIDVLFGSSSMKPYDSSVSRVSPDEKRNAVEKWQTAEILIKKPELRIRARFPLCSMTAQIRVIGAEKRDEERRGKNTT